ncbi:hypothetical protein GCM10017708_05880 [Arthrobacter citreus]
MLVYVLDAYALIELESICASDRDIRSCLNAMTTSVQSGELTFPDRVVKHCRSFDPDGHGYLWSHASSGHRHEHEAPDACITRVMINSPEIMSDDQDSKENSDLAATPVDVLALAISLHDRGATPVIVSGEPGTLPDRETLATIAPTFSIRVITPAQYMHLEGLGQHLAA